MNIFERILVSLGLAEEKEENEEDEEYEIEGERREDLAPVKGDKKSRETKKSKVRGKSKKSVVPLNPRSKNSDYNILIVAPSNYDEAPSISEYIKDYQPVIVNLENLDIEVGRQLVDFVSGTVFGLDGTVHKIGKQIILFSPPNVDVLDNMGTEITGEEWGSLD